MAIRQLDTCSILGRVNAPSLSLAHCLHVRVFIMPRSYQGSCGMAAAVDSSGERLRGLNMSPRHFLPLHVIILRKAELTAMLPLASPASGRGCHSGYRYGCCCILGVSCRLHAVQPLLPAPSLSPSTVHALFSVSSGLGSHRGYYSRMIKH